ncbi:MAG: amidohydrolase family protein [Actinomycetota bacterium]
MSRRILIGGGCVLTLGARTPNHPEADVLIEDDRVVEIGSGLRARGAEIVDATNAIVMPGFVDTHRHVWRSLFRNLGEIGSPDGTPVTPDDYGRHYEPDDVYAATLVGLLGAIEAGITTVVDWADIRPEDGHIDAALQAHEDAGLRTLFVHAPSTWSLGPDEEKARLRRLAARKAASGGSGHTIAFGPGDPDRSDLDRTARDWMLARELEMRVHTHVGASSEQEGSIADLADRGLLGPDVTLIHCSHLDERDLDAIASHGARVSLAPSSEMADGFGMPPMQELIDRDIRPGLGVDSERLASGDIFAQMRSANSVQHALHFDLKLAGKGALPNLLSTREVIKFATIDGANVAGLGDVTGSIEPGKEADVVVLRTDRPNIWPINDPIGAVVWGMDTSNVDWVISGGRVLMREGELVADVARARDLAAEAKGRVAAAAGLLTGTGSSA